MNEVADVRAALLGNLFAGSPLSMHDAAQIHDRLDAGVVPSCIIMNPPFSAALNVDSRVADAAIRHLSSAVARLADGGRLVAITGATSAHLRISSSATGSCPQFTSDQSQPKA